MGNHDPKGEKLIEDVADLLLEACGYDDEPDESEAHRLYEIAGWIITRVRCDLVPDGTQERRG